MVSSGPRDLNLRDFMANRHPYLQMDPDYAENLNCGLGLSTMITMCILMRKRQETGPRRLQDRPKETVRSSLRTRHRYCLDLLLGSQDLDVGMDPIECRALSRLRPLYSILGKNQIWKDIAVKITLTSASLLICQRASIAKSIKSK